MVHILLIVLYLVTVGLSAYSCGWLLLRAERNGTTGALAACQLLVILWCIPQLFGGFPMTKGVKYLIYGVSYLSICLIGPAWLAFSFLYCQRRPKRRVWVLLLGLSALHYLAFLTNEYHHLFYRRFEVDEVVYGQIFYFHMCYTYLCVLVGLGVVMREFWKKRVAALHLAVILLSAAVPMVFNILYLSGLAGTPFDLTPLAFAISSFLMLLAVLRYDFLDVNALAFGQIFSSITEGVAVYNVRGTVVYCNEAAAAWLGIRAGDHFSGIKEQLAGQGLAVEQGRELLAEDAEIGLESGGRLRIRQYIRRSRNGKLIAGTFLLTDVGEYYERLKQNRELAVAAQRLAIEQERNRIAQEVHDTTGHTLTMIQSLLRLARVEWEQENGEGREEQGEAGNGDGGKEETVQGKGMKGEKEREVQGKELKGEKEREVQRKELKGEKEEAVQGKGQDGKKDGKDKEKGLIGEYLAQAQELAVNGIRELRISINQLRQGTEWGLVTQGIFQLAKSVKELEVEVEIQGEDGPGYSHLSMIAYDCLREAITNCLKYAHATHMDVIVKFERKSLSLYVFDNGQGCGEIVKNNGIRGIRERVEKAGGRVRILSLEGEGFQIYIWLPVSSGGR